MTKQITSQAISLQENEPEVPKVWDDNTFIRLCPCVYWK